MNHFVIRIFRADDAVKCARIINECHVAMPELSDEQVRFLLAKYTPDYLRVEYVKHYVLVCENNGQIFGVGSLIDDGEIRGLYVDPCRQKMGVGKRLMFMLEKEARERGMGKVFVKAYFAPESFYKKLGYVSLDPGEVKAGGIPFKFVNMEKKLSKAT